MTASELSRIEKQVLIRAPRHKVWHALTNLDEFARWFLVEAHGAFAPGVRVEMVSRHPKGAGAKFSVTVEAMEPERLFSWRWHPGSKPADGDYTGQPGTLVEFRLEDAEGGTRVTVVESGFERLSLAGRAKAFADNTEGWEIQLAALNEYAGTPA
ncbi:MAG TPA: SRPBCC family protein [Bryobacteraceae bacterium]|nr:SRPBCC family protein [Bryobacteraceae bacterium]